MSGCRTSPPTISRPGCSPAPTTPRTSAPAWSAGCAWATTSPRTSSSRRSTARPRSRDSTFRDILPGGIFPAPKEILRYYDLSVGYNIFPGEIFLGRNHAKVSAFYLIAGLGSTKFNDASHQTVNVGAGMRVFLKDWVAVQLDVRDHMYSIDLLGSKKNTNNLETTAGVTFFF